MSPARRSALAALLVLAATAELVIWSPGEPDTHTIRYCWDATCAPTTTTETP